MATAISARPFIWNALPENRAARIATQLALVVGGTALLAVSARTKGVLGPVDMSLQTLAVFLSGASFGLRLGLATLVLYMIEGALGWPVCPSTPDKGLGLVYMLGSSRRCPLGFVLSAAAVGWRAHRGLDRASFRFVGGLLVAQLGLLPPGYAWLAGLIGAEKAWTFGVLPHLVPDLIKVRLA